MEKFLESLEKRLYLHKNYHPSQLYQSYREILPYPSFARKNFRKKIAWVENCDGFLFIAYSKPFFTTLNSAISSIDNFIHEFCAMISRKCF